MQDGINCSHFCIHVVFRFGKSRENFLCNHKGNDERKLFFSIQW